MKIKVMFLFVCMLLAGCGDPIFAPLDTGIDAQCTSDTCSVE